VTGYGVAPILSEHSEPGRRSAEALNIPRLPPQCSRHDPKQIEIPKAFYFWCIQGNRPRRGFSSRKTHFATIACAE